MKTRSVLITFFCFFSFNGLLHADQGLVLQPVSQNVYAIVGDLGNRSVENHGNNASFGFVVTREGVVLIDSGGTYEGAQAIDAVIKTVTDKPVVKVINSGGQDHRWLGNGYFKQQGAQIIASVDAVADQKTRVKDQFFRLGSLLGEDQLKSTVAVYAETTFEKYKKFRLGDTDIEIYHAGQAHTPGDSFIWLPQSKVMFSGDIVYIQRMLGIMDHSNSQSWINVFQTMAEYQPQWLVPGHGKVTDLATAKKDTLDYLQFLRAAVTEFMDEGGDIADIGQIDQSRFDYLLNFDQLSGRNAQQVYTELEWE